MKKYLFLPFIFALISCGTHSFFEDLTNDILGELRTGWLAGAENLSLIPQDIASFAGDVSGLPASYSLESKFPPIGDQGQYGTCVAWATGYNLKTALNGMDKNWSAADLARGANQTSPKDLWFTIPASQKGASCEGTNFEYALDALISKGASSLSDVPYSGLGNCSGTSGGNASNKLANYRKIAYDESLQGGTRKDGMNVSNFKGYLSQGRPVLIGARLGDRFMRWNSSAVISSDTYNDPGMQHAYHAMILSGYDDSKNAFRVRNSWGADWGNNGSIWVDYDFFLNNFCFAAFVAQNPPSSAPNNNNQPASGYDLLASYAEDYDDTESANARDRVFYYEILNNGSLPILASQKWTVYYMYYNAYNANEYEIIFEDYYTNERGNPGDYGRLTTTQALVGSFWNNMDVASGKKVGEARFGAAGFETPYRMPSITGDYYLVVYADAKEVIQETNEDNNFYYITAANGRPLNFRNGIMQSTPSVATNALGKRQAGTRALASSVVELGELNAYTPQEIKSVLKRDKQSGALAKKIAKFRDVAPVKIPRRQ